MNPIEQLIEALQYTQKAAYDDLYELIVLAQEYDANRYNNVTRFEVIDGAGRSYVKQQVAVNLSLQDDNRTLKVFVDARPEK